MNPARILSLTGAIACFFAWSGPAVAQERVLDTAKIEEITGLKGTWNETEGVFKVSAPRTDLKVSVDRRTMPPFMGLTSWAAFQKGKAAETMVMGDLVLLQDEVNPVMSELLGAGVAVTALHNHFFYDEPKAYFMHLGGEGETQALARGVRRALDKVKEIRTAHPEAAPGFGGEALPEKSSITGKAIEEVIGQKGQTQDGMFKVVIGRKTKSACGCELGKEMGVNTWAAFAGSDENAVVDGDFAVLEAELQGVLKSLRASGINIVAIHHHMTLETPRILFLHYWGRGKAADLVRDVKAALDTEK
jgi:hypothetical protein